ncbi:DNA primase family protein [Azospirillum sp. ST 5-10]|uniref:DNA primase family protein n=1 Tax=unclassified Azospirillum TaxID=2630922 RepID=UPI003F4A72D7
MCPLDHDSGGAAALDELAAAIDGAALVDVPADGGEGDDPPPGLGAADPLDLAQYEQNDTGNGRRLRARWGDDLVFVDRRGWLCWDGRRFSMEMGEAGLVRRCHWTLRQMAEEIEALRKLGPPEPSEEEIDAAEADPKYAAKLRDERIKAWHRALERFETWRLRSGDAGHVKAMAEMARAYVTRPARAMDADPWLLCAGNGTLDLRHRPETAVGMALRAHRRADLITRLAGARFDPDARAPTFDRFIRRILPDDAVRSFVQRLLGYCLTGLVSEQIFVIFYGVGKNGKSTLVDIIREVFGDYAATVPVGVFLDQGPRNADGPKPTLAKLPGIRLVLMAEPDKGSALSEGLVKEVTGGEPIEARDMHEKSFEYRPQFTAIMSTNYKPIIRGQDIGIWRRVLLVPFEVVIPPGERDPLLLDKLRQEKDGILSWLLDGLWLWHEEGLDPPDAIRAAVEEYQRDSDPIGEFLDACTLPSPGERVTAHALYQAYCTWCQDNAVDALKANAFGRRMRDRGARVQKSMGINHYVGLRLQSPATAPAGGAGEGLI